MVGGVGRDGAEAPAARYGRKVQLTYEEQLALEEERRLLTPSSRYRPPARKSRLWMLLVIIVVVAAIASFAGYTYLIPGGSSPEETFRGFVEAINAGDARKAIDYTVDKFASDSAKDAEVETLEADWTENGRLTITIHSMEVVHRDDMGPTVRAELDDLENQVESLFDVNVKDSCGLTFNTTSVQGSETNSGDGNIPLVMIGQSWYIATIYAI